MKHVHQKALTKLSNRVLEIWPRANADQIHAAFQFGRKAHGRELRRSGRPYFLTHCVPVAWICTQWAFGEKLILAALLHDTIENTTTTRTTIRKQFGPRVAHIVDSVTKISEYVQHEERLRHIETMVKLFKVAGQDYRPYLLKLADRMHNMRTLFFLPPTKQRHIAHQTLQIYAPVAHRLGMQKVRRSLEDQSFFYLNQEMYYFLIHKIKRQGSRRLKTFNRVAKKLIHRARREGISITIKPSPLHLYHIFRRMQSHEFDDLYTNLLSFRVICRNLMDCFTLLDLITETFGELVEPPKDYFYAAKSNEYSSLHAVVADAGKQKFQFLICTEELETVAENGIVALKNFRMNTDNIEVWIQNMLDNIEDTEDVEESLEILQMDLFADEIPAYTPQGKIIRLPKNASCIDFAFALHTEIGNQCAGATVNNKPVPISTNLKRDNVVHIDTAPDAHPLPEWESLVRTSKAKAAIRNWLRLHPEDTRKKQIS